MASRHGSIPEGASQPSATRQALNDVAFGSVAGMVAEVFEYPLDLAKVRLQSQVLDGQKRFGGPLDCLSQTWRNEGVLGLYRGLTVPIVGSMAQTAGLFLAYSQLQNLVRWSANSPPSSDLNLTQLGVAAGGAGLLTSFILTPLELIKCKMQVQMISAPLLAPQIPSPSSTSSTAPGASKGSLPAVRRTLPGPLALATGVLRKDGIPGLYTGHVATMVRETGGTALWFASKEFVASMLLSRREYSSLMPSSLESTSPNTALLPWESALSGAVAGGVCVLGMYPADTVKSAMQTADDLHPPDKFTPTRHLPPRYSFWTMTKAMYKAQGLRGLYAGCGMTVARAIPSSGIVFVVYDGLSQYFG